MLGEGAAALRTVSALGTPSSSTARSPDGGLETAVLRAAASATRKRPDLRAARVSRFPPLAWKLRKKLMAQAFANTAASVLPRAGGREKGDLGGRQIRGGDTGAASDPQDARL
jgi:hypothetical protein